MGDPQTPSGDGCLGGCWNLLMYPFMAIVALLVWLNGGNW